VVRFERLATLLCQGVEGWLEDVALVEVRSVVAGVNSPAESPKCVAT
jgi:hypothetical protein